ncbi:MAG: DHH family phosphoesterase [Clostridia bacterium]
MTKTKQFLLENDNYLILTHKKPDGDTTGTASALCQVLRAINKTAYILPNEDITPRYEGLISPYLAPSDFKFDKIISADLATTELLPESAKKYEKDIDLCIDHHFLSNDGYAKNNLIVDVAACAEIIYDLALELEVELNADLAKSLYVAISTDTGCFKYSNTTAHTHKIAGECLTYIDAGPINRELFDVKTRQRIEVEKVVYQHIEYYFNNEVAIVCILQKDVQEIGATPDDLDSIASLPRAIEGVLIGLTIFEQENGDIKVSCRSSGDFSASEICGVYGGGGHLRAGGVTFKNTKVEDAKKKIIEAVTKVCNYV